jgi:hypothetical protein
MQERPVFEPKIKIDHKIIFTGPVGAGKTTAIGAISEIPPICTDEIASDATQQRKDATTVAMDYGLVRLGGADKVHLYGTPGQERFRFMWDILSKGGIGLVLLIDNTRPDPLEDLQFYINAFRSFINSTRLVVGITQMDLQRTPALAQYANLLNQLKIFAPVFEVDARRRDDVSILIQALLLSLDHGIPES